MPRVGLGGRRVGGHRPMAAIAGSSGRRTFRVTSSFQLPIIHGSPDPAFLLLKAHDIYLKQISVFPSAALTQESPSPTGDLYILATLSQM